jgi:hypothetical protein
LIPTTSHFSSEKTGSCQLSSSVRMYRQGSFRLVTWKTAIKLSTRGQWLCVVPFAFHLPDTTHFQSYLVYTFSFPLTLSVTLVHIFAV